MVFCKTDKHEYWLGRDAHALIAHVRLAGKAFQLSLGIALEDISGTGSRWSCRPYPGSQCQHWR